MDLYQHREMIKNLLTKVSEETLISFITEPPADKLLATIKNRIMRKGTDSSGKNIGSYSTTPLRVVREQMVKQGAFTPSGKRTITTEVFPVRYSKKTGKSIKAKKGKQIHVHEKTYTIPKSMYLEEGYKQLRDIQGMETDHVTLNYFGDLILDYQMGKSGDGKYVLLGFTQDSQWKKKEGLEAHFNTTIFKATEKEMEQYERDVFSRYTKFVSQVLNGEYGSGNVSGVV